MEEQEYVGNDVNGDPIYIGDTVELLGKDEHGNFRCGINGSMRELVGITMVVERQKGGSIVDVSGWSWPTERMVLTAAMPPKFTDEDFSSVFA